MICLNIKACIRSLALINALMFRVSSNNLTHFLHPNVSDYTRRKNTQLGIKMQRPLVSMRNSSLPINRTFIDEVIDATVDKLNLTALPINGTSIDEVIDATVDKLNLTALPINGTSIDEVIDANVDKLNLTAQIQDGSVNNFQTNGLNGMFPLFLFISKNGKIQLLAIVRAVFDYMRHPKMIDEENGIPISYRFHELHFPLTKNPSPAPQADPSFFSQLVSNIQPIFKSSLEPSLTPTISMPIYYPTAISSMDPSTNPSSLPLLNPIKSYSFQSSNIPSIQSEAEWLSSIPTIHQSQTNSGISTSNSSLHIQNDVLGHANKNQSTSISPNKRIPFVYGSILLIFGICTMFTINTLCWGFLQKRDNETPYMYEDWMERSSANIAVFRDDDDDETCEESWTTSSFGSAVKSLSSEYKTCYDLNSSNLEKHYDGNQFHLNKKVKVSSDKCNANESVHLCIDSSIQPEHESEKDSAFEAIWDDRYT